MSFNIALSGLKAAQKDLDVTSNNIANVSTVGFKQSRAEFADVYSSSLLASGKSKAGDGVLTANVAQQFKQGGVNDTENALDLAIAGNGFFATVPEIGSSERSYTRAGMFKLDKDNFVITNQGDNLLGFPVNTDGTSASTSLATAIPLRIPTSSGAPLQTSEIKMAMNLPSGATHIAGAPGNFDPDDKLTYNEKTSETIYDSLGNTHLMTYFFIKDDVATKPNEWIVFAAIDGKAINLVETTAGDALADGRQGGVTSGPLSGSGGVIGARLVFDNTGDFISQVPTLANGGIQTAPFTNYLNNGADETQNVKMNFLLNTNGPDKDEPAQWSGKFSIKSRTQDGLAVGRLKGIEIAEDGLVRATYSNGTSEPLARIALINFANEQGLSQVGNTSWKESLTSGAALAGEATTGTFGLIKSKALEQSNVNLTTELIDLITAQRNFQANSKALETNNTISQTILQIR